MNYAKYSKSLEFRRSIEFAYDGISLRKFVYFVPEHKPPEALVNLYYPSFKWLGHVLYADAPFFKEGMDSIRRMSVHYDSYLRWKNGGTWSFSITISVFTREDGYASAEIDVYDEVGWQYNRGVLL